jgi:hypothetical protein
METDAWPTRNTLRSPFNHNTKAAVGEPHLQPSVSSQTINQISNEMGKTQPPPSQSLDPQCQNILSKMLEFPEMDPPMPAEDAYLNGSGVNSGENRELNKLLSAGYQLLDKKDGEWSQADIPNNTKLLLE